MMEQNFSEPREEYLWRLAKKRVDFRTGLAVYCVLVPFLWGVWWFTLGQHVGFNWSTWPLYVTLGWGMGVLSSYYQAYGSGKGDPVAREYEKLKKEQGDRYVQF